MQAPLGLTPGHRGPDRDLGPVAGLPGHRRDLHRAVGDLGHLQREQLADQVGVGPADSVIDGPRRPLVTPHHVRLQPQAVLVDLARHLLRRRQHRLDLAEVDQHDPALGPALVVLHDAADDVALAAGPLAEGVLVLGVAQPLQDDLLGGHRRDPAEVLRGVVPLPQRPCRPRPAPGPRR